ncbi:hypothetical protein ACHAWF_007087 [Thalassiosira exigua]
MDRPLDDRLGSDARERGGGPHETVGPYDAFVMRITHGWLTLDQITKADGRDQSNGAGRGKELASPPTAGLDQRRDSAGPRVRELHEPIDLVERHPPRVRRDPSGLLERRMGAARRRLPLRPPFRPGEVASLEGAGVRRSELLDERRGSGAVQVEPHLRGREPLVSEQPGAATFGERGVLVGVRVQRGGGEGREDDTRV